MMRRFALLPLLLLLSACGLHPLYGGGSGGQVAGLLLGSVTHRLLHIAPCPVFAVPTRNAKSADQDIAGATASVG